MKTTIAIDPGVSGGIACREGSEIKCWPMPEGDRGIADLLYTIEAKRQPGIPLEVWLEQVPTFAGRNIPGHCMAKLHGNARFIEGWLSRAGARIIRVTPQKWQKHLGLGTRKEIGSDGAWKRKLRDEAARRFPTADVSLKTADALLILEFAHETKGDQ